MGPWATQTTTPSPQSPQAPANSLNHTKNLHLEFLGLTKDHTLTMWPTSTHKPPKPHQTPMLWVLGSYEGPHLHCGTHKCPLTPLTTPDTYAVGTDAFCFRAAWCTMLLRGPLPPIYSIQDDSTFKFHSCQCYFLSVFLCQSVFVSLSLSLCVSLLLSLSHSLSLPLSLSREPFSY